MGAVGVSDDKAGGFRGAWRHRRWRWLLGSYAVSMTGDFLYAGLHRAGIAGLQATTLKSPDRPSPAALPLLLAPAAVVVGMIAVPVAVAVRRSWRKRG